MDEKLVELASDGASGREMGAATGMDPAKALIRVKEILRERDWATEMERRQMLMDDLLALKRRVQEQQADMDFLSDKQITALAKVIESADNILEKLGKGNDDLINRVSTAQAVAMLRLIDAGMKRAKTILTQQHPELDFQEISAAFQEGLTEAADLLE